MVFATGCWMRSYPPRPFGRPHRTRREPLPPARSDVHPAPASVCYWHSARGVRECCFPKFSGARAASRKTPAPRPQRASDAWTRGRSLHRERRGDVRRAESFKRPVGALSSGRPGAGSGATDRRCARAGLPRHGPSFGPCRGAQGEQRRRLGNQDAVDDVDDPVGRAHVGGDDLRPVHEHAAAADADPHALAVERLDRRALDDALRGEPA